MCVWHLFLSNATLSNAASLVCLCAVCRVEDHHASLDDSPCLKNTRIRQVVSDEWC